ncbi:hypothetical protein LELG_03364 [Lodderomyces elongisporus NRRL YB-4239]|uniref:Uncharacterized protein n=1 Tax=Lodderomyces elongisporus (strain ATCC 11503 / CBS 2605 / JCM 1781 / NBRC 1676 / NRRL YB-4239) TaxID=379508 RepID=A5E177_LODEL|nr:hypothetical protein LELG_03364 [Lodderomyces elongisporus NRRL YB-4239]
MDLSNLSRTLPLLKPLHKEDERRRNTSLSGTGAAAASVTSSQSTSSTSSTSSTADYTDLTTHFKDAAKAIASLYNTALGVQNLTNTNDETPQKLTLKTDFAQAARSVAVLYKYAQMSHPASFDQGYLNCIDDLLQIITNDEDVENWALTRRAEITKLQKTSNKDNERERKEKGERERDRDRDREREREREKDIESDSVLNFSQKSVVKNSLDSLQSKTAFDDGKLPSDFAFQFALDLRPPTAFRPSIPPLSVLHNPSQRNLAISKKNRFHQQILKKVHSSEDSSESESDDLKRVKIFKDNTSPSRKKKRKNNATSNINNNINDNDNESGNDSTI